MRLFCFKKSKSESQWQNPSAALQHSRAPLSLEEAKARLVTQLNLALMQESNTKIYLRLPTADCVGEFSEKQLLDLIKSWLLNNEESGSRIPDLRALVFRFLDAKNETSSLTLEMYYWLVSLANEHPVNTECNISLLKREEIIRPFFTASGLFCDQDSLVQWFRTKEFSGPSPLTTPLNAWDQAALKPHLSKSSFKDFLSASFSEISGENYCILFTCSALLFFILILILIFSKHWSISESIAQNLIQKEFSRNPSAEALFSHSENSSVLEVVEKDDDPYRLILRNTQKGNGFNYFLHWRSGRSESINLNDCQTWLNFCRRALAKQLSEQISLVLSEIEELISLTLERSPEFLSSSDRRRADFLYFTVYNYWQLTGNYRREATLVSRLKSSQKKKLVSESINSLWETYQDLPRPEEQPQKFALVRFPSCR